MRTCLLRECQQRERHQFIRFQHGHHKLCINLYLVLFFCFSLVSRCERGSRQVLPIFHRCSEYIGVKYFREKILQVLLVLAVFGLCVMRDTASTRSISIFCTANTAILAVFGGSILWNTAVLEVYWGLILWNTLCT